MLPVCDFPLETIVVHSKALPCEYVLFDLVGTGVNTNKPCNYLVLSISKHIMIKLYDQAKSYHYAGGPEGFGCIYTSDRPEATLQCEAVKLRGEEPSLEA